MRKINLKIKPNEKLRAAMILSGHTQESIALSLGIAYSTFSQKLNGHRDFTLPECLRIAQILGTTLDSIFFTDSVPNQEQKKA